VGLIAAGAAVYSSSAGAHGRGGSVPPRQFTNADLNGSYGILEQGTALGLTYFEVARLEADGNGRMFVEFVGNLGGQLVSRTNNCDYVVRPNGTGSMDCIDNEGEQTLGELVIVDGGRAFKFITLPDPNFQIFGTAERQ
jgi:hypothetical protein